MTYQPAFDAYEARVRESFDGQSMMATFGAKITKVEPGAVEIRAPILSTSLQQQGFGHAALAFGIGDSAAGYAALTLMEKDSEVLTVEMKISLLAPAAGNALVARGRVLKPGRRIMSVESDIFADLGDEQKLIARMLGTMITTKN